jgi:GNAT superfamily N-acetyltransferase
MEIRRASPDHAEACMAIALDLRDFFNDDAMERMPRDLLDHRVYVAEEDGGVQGFITLLMRNADVAEVSWLAVRRDLWRKGIGSGLVSTAEEGLRREGLTVLEVKTLADTVDYPPYEGTRAFYKALGFVHLETVDPYPGVAPGNPIAIYVKPIS